MAAGASSQTIRATGRWVVNPTDLATAYPHGGVEVGRSQSVVMQPLGVPYVIESEALGAPTDVLEPANRFVVSFFLRGWDDEAVEQFLANGQSVGSLTGRAGWDAPGSSAPGSSALGRSVSMLFAPRDTNHAPAMLIRRGVPHWTPASELAWSRNDELGIPITVECLPDTSGQTLTIQRLEDITL